MATLTEIALMAGVFEGEGTICARRQGREVTMSVQMSARDTVEKFIRYFGGSFLGPYPPRIDYRTGKRALRVQWKWQMHRWSDVIRTCEVIRPFLGEDRKVQMDDVLRQAPVDALTRIRRINGIRCPAAPLPDKSGYMRHWRRGEKPCPICKESYTLWTRAHRAIQQANLQT